MKVRGAQRLLRLCTEAFPGVFAGAFLGGYNLLAFWVHKGAQACNSQLFICQTFKVHWQVRVLDQLAEHPTLLGASGLSTWSGRSDPIRAGGVPDSTNPGIWSLKSGTVEQIGAIATVARPL